MRQLSALMMLATQAGSVFSRTVQKKLQSLIARLALLPSAPRIEVIQLMQGILALNPLILVTDDTVNEEQRPELTRIFLMELTEVPCFDYQFSSSSHEKAGLLAADGSATIGDQPPLASLEQEWAHFQTLLHGRYVIAFHLPLVQIQLAVTAKEHGLPIPMVIGHSLLDLLLKYARVKEPIDEELEQDALPFSDTHLCNVLAKEDVEPFTDLTSATSNQRALHLLHALQAMANGTFSLQEPLPASSMVPFNDPFSGPFSGGEFEPS